MMEGMDLSTLYLGMLLPHPLIPGASPLSKDLDTIRELEDAGAPAIVLHSLFEEQIIGARATATRTMDHFGDTHPEALAYYPKSHEFAFGPDRYLNHLRRIKTAIDIPVIASLNGTTPGGWTEHARLIEQAGADALELNLYPTATDLLAPGEEVERHALDVAVRVRMAVTIPVAVKLSPFYSSLANLVHELAELGIDAVVLFNRFYQPDIDIERLRVTAAPQLSSSSDLLLRVRWLATLAGRTKTCLACSGGVHTAEDAVKAVMAGADAVQVVSALLLHGPGYLQVLRERLARWFEAHEYDSLRHARSCLSLLRCPDPRAFERGNYMRILQNWKPADAGTGTVG